MALSCQRSGVREWRLRALRENLTSAEREDLTLGFEKECWGGKVACRGGQDIEES